MSALRSPQASQAPPSRSVGSGTRPATRLPVIFVDTDSEAHRAVAHALADRFHVHGVHMLAEAITLAESLRPRVILFSVSFPAIDLLIFGRVMRERHRDVRLLGVTRAGQAKEVARAMQVGANGVVEKPVDDLALLGIVEKHAAP
jgi:PleD family two-component response regulator